jgi:hypothetical protein
MNEQMFMMIKVGGHLWWVMILVEVLTEKCMKGNTSQFQNFRVNFHKIHLLFSVRVS